MDKLTIADKKILHLMEYNPRIPLKSLATACYVSKDTVKYRINRLEKINIIQGYTSFIDYKKLGHQSYKLYLKLNGTAEQKESLKTYLRKQKSVFALFESVGQWNLGVALFVRDHELFNGIENNLLEQFGHIISARRFCSMIDVTLIPKDLLGSKITSTPPEKFLSWGKIENNTLDILDKKLIKLMHENARITLVALAEELKLSLDATKHRIARLNKKEIVKTYQTTINYHLLGFDQYKLFIFPKSYANETETKIIKYLSHSPNCINIVRTIGPWKLEAEFLAKSYQDVENIINELNKRFTDNIAELELSVIRNVEIFACKELLLE